MFGETKLRIMYQFREQLNKEELTRLDTHFRARFAIQDVSPTEQKLGMDRVFVNADGYRYSVEYKADHKGGETGNAFIETISQDSRNVLGWALTSCAQIHVHFFPTVDFLLWGEALRLRRRVFRWMKKYESRDIPNADKEGNFIYNTKGVLVPVHELENINFKREQVKRETT